MVNSLVPVVSLVGVQAGGLLGGTVLTESVFSWPGLGNLTVNAISTKDFPVVIVAVVVIAAVFIVVNFVADILVALLDPRAADR